MSVEVYDPTAPLFNVSPEAVDQVRSLMEEMSSSTVGLRIFVQGGGCSGFQYGFAFADKINEDDSIIEQDGIKFLVDELSYQYLVGATINYTVELYGARFEISNPNASTTCGCGASFNI